MAMNDEIREQTDKMKAMTPEQKWDYFWTYYKIPFWAAILGIAVLVYCIHDASSRRDDALYAVMINADSASIPTDALDKWDSDLAGILKLDTKKYQAYVDDSMTLSLNSSDQYSMSNSQKFMAMSAANQLDAVVADEEIYEYYSQFQYFENLNDVLTKEQLSEYSDCLYYTDRSTFSDTDSDNFELSDLSSRKIDHHDPSTMKDPIPVGIFVTDAQKVKADKCYDYLSVKKVTYQGHTSEPVVGIPVTSKHQKAGIAFIGYIFGKN
jgi:hypothetical protein